MSTHSTATSESNSNGKRERDEDEEDEQLLREAPNYKKLVVTDATTGTAATSDDNESDRQALSDALAKENLEDNESSKTLSTEAEENPEESMNHDNHPKEPQQKDKEDAPTDTIGDETPSIETQHRIPTQTSEQQGPARDDTEQANPAAATPVESSNAPPPPQTSTNNNDDAAADSSSTKTSSSSAVHNTNTAPPPSSSSSSSSLPHPSVPQPSPAPGPSHSSTSFPHQQPPPPSRPVAPMQHQQQQTIQQPQPHSDEEIVERGQVPALYVGRVIGKGGEMIRDLQARSGARIDVDQNVPAGHPRVITYRGTRDTVDFAKRLGE
jgi:far upstream element-binding protein